MVALSFLNNDRCKDCACVAYQLHFWSSHPQSPVLGLGRNVLPSSKSCVFYRHNWIWQGQDNPRNKGFLIERVVSHGCKCSLSVSVLFLSSVFHGHKDIGNTVSVKPHGTTRRGCLFFLLVGHPRVLTLLRFTFVCLYI